MKKTALLILTLAIFVVSACRKNNETYPSSYDLIVEGGINTLTASQYIRLTRPASFGQMSSPAVSGAVVTVNDGVENVPFLEIGATGIYTAIVARNKNFYEPYVLRIQHDNKVYSASDTLVPVLPIDESYLPLKASQNGNRVRLNIPAHTFGTTSPQQWLFLPNGINWSPQDFSGELSYSYSHIYGTPNALNPLTRRTTVIYLEPAEKIDVYKFSISDRYSRYLYNFFQETEWRGLLSSVPANLKGNISGNANGFFYAVDVERKTFTGYTLLGK
jgi:Domain of unknown function (DUF4249)